MIRRVKPTADVLLGDSGLQREIVACAFAAKRSRGSSFAGDFEEAEDFLFRLAEMGHHSVFEHSLIPVKIRCSRIASHELVRHRHTAITQSSTRYVDLARNDVRVIFPTKHSDGRVTFEGFTAADRQVIKTVEGAMQIYAEMQASVGREYARYVLPHCIETSLVISASIREWWHLLKVRSSKAAAPEVREISRQIVKRFEAASKLLTWGVGQFAEK